MRFAGSVHGMLRKEALGAYILSSLLVLFALVSCSGAQECVLAGHHTPVCDAQCSLSFNCSSCDTSMHGCGPTCFADGAKGVMVSGEQAPQTRLLVDVAIVTESALFIGGQYRRLSGNTAS